MANDIKDFGDYSVKNVKSFMGREGLGFNANLYRGKKKIAFCFDDARGGEVDIDWVGGWKGEEATLLEQHIATLPKVQSSYSDMELTIDQGWFVSELVTKWEQEKDLRKMKKQCMTKILFRTPKHKLGQYVIMSATFNGETKAKIQAKYGNDVEIFNEVLAKGETPSVLA